MSNPNDRQPSKREVHTDADGNVHARETHYQDGYTNGREVEEERLLVNQRVRSNGPGPGLLIGIALASLLGVGVVVWYLLSQTSNEPVQQIIVPENEAPTSPQTPQAPSPPDVNITVPSVEVPQTPQAPSPPDVNITVPSVEVPQPSQAPSSVPENNSNTTAPSSQSDTTNTTPTSPSNSSTTSPTDNSTSSEQDQQ
jgi:hypothetical protein